MEYTVRHMPGLLDQVNASIDHTPSLHTQSVVSLFSGCGGMDLGFLGGFRFAGHYYEELPFRIDWANDISTAACETYSLNFNHDINCGDVMEVLDSLPETADIVIGGFPCQDVSINGSRLAGSGKRTILYKAMLEVIRRTRPKVFVAENVKGLLMSHGRDFYREMMADFSALEGYQVSDRLYLAADYGVPQMRERIFIIGVRGEKSFMHPVRVFDETQRLTAGDVLRDLEDLPKDTDFSHVWSLANASPDQGSRKLTEHKPSSTIRAECHGNIQFHYKLDRRISMREAARLQSFPDEFVFPFGLRETERQIGNAVPPVLAWHLACAVRNYLNDARML
ncbi:MAG: DNA cytosine methyltransferase [Chloroflexi bacterium]|nr:DNA cytosine methyltransferase [Chloroflexota bacterium]